MSEKEQNPEIIVEKIEGLFPDTLKELRLLQDGATAPGGDAMAEYEERIETMTDEQALRSLKNTVILHAAMKGLTFEQAAIELGAYDLLFRG